MCQKRNGKRYKGGRRVVNWIARQGKVFSLSRHNILDMHAHHGFVCFSSRSPRILRSLLSTIPRQETVYMSIRPGLLAGLFGSSLQFASFVHRWAMCSQEPWRRVLRRQQSLPLSSTWIAGAQCETVLEDLLLALIGYIDQPNHVGRTRYSRPGFLEVVCHRRILVSGPSRGIQGSRRV